MKFYVYELIDPIVGEVFYVGKGKNSRVHAHEVEASKGMYSRKCERIRAIWALSAEVKHRIVSRHDDENEALQAEFDLIAQYGLDNLTNVLPGGVMGTEVYLAHLAAAQERRKLKEKKDLAKTFERVAPQMAMVLRARETGNQVGAWVGGRWLDFTEAFYELFKTILKTLGFEFVQSRLAPHGIILKVM